MVAKPSQYQWLNGGWAIMRKGSDPGSEMIANVAEYGSEIPSKDALSMKYCPSDRPRWMN